MTLSDISSGNKFAAIVAVLSLVISVNISESSTVNGVVTSCSYFDFGKLILGGIAIALGLTAATQAARLPEKRPDRKMNMAIGPIAAVIGAYSALVGLGLIGGPC